jgi:hypothetical protein
MTTSLTFSPLVQKTFINRLSTLLTLVILCGGCTLRLIGDYDDIIDKGMTDFQQKLEAYLSKRAADPNATYDQTFYDDVNARLTAMRSRAQASFKKDILVHQMDDLIATVADLQKADKAGKLTPAFIQGARTTLSVEIESILKLELALKRGDTAATK